MQKSACFRLLVRVAAAVVLLGGLSATVDARSADIRFQNDKMSANLKETPLIDILIRLEKEKNIQFACNESVRETPISVEFANLPLEEGLQRILAFMNYSLIFDRDQRVRGITIVGFDEHHEPKAAKAAAKPTGGATGGPARRTDSALPPVTGDKLPLPDPSAELSASERETFKVLKNSPPPGGVTTTTDNPSPPPDPEPEAFKVIKNSPPPGGPIPSPKPASDDFQIIRNAPPPGNG